MKENFLNLVMEIDMQVQEAQRVPNKMDANRPTPRHITIKMPKVKHKERILKATRKGDSYLQRSSHNTTSLFLKGKLCRQEGTGKKYSK